MSKHRKSGSKRLQAETSRLLSLPPLRLDLLCVAFLFVLTLILFRDIIFKGMVFSTGADTANAESYARAAQLLESREDQDVIWMPFFFSGMPTFGNLAYIPHDVNYLQRALVSVLKLIYLNGPHAWYVAFYFLSGVFMFLLMRGLSFPALPSLFAAAAYMLSPYAVGLAGEGHGSKLWSLTYLPLVFLLVHKMFEKRNALYTGLAGAVLGTMFLARHVQIAYYTLLLLGLYLVFTIARDYRARPVTWPWKAALLAAVIAIAFSIASYIYLSVYDYQQYSIRGGGTAGTTGGLAWDYATNWSWNPLEIITLFIPGFFGFQLPYYWGPIDPWTNSSVYVGLLPLLLAMVAVRYRRTAETWFFLILTVVVLILSFGRTIPIVYELFFTYFPFFDKFRAPAMILHLIAFSIPILGAYGLIWLIELRANDPGESHPQLLRSLRIATGVFAGLAVLFLLLKSSLFDTLSGSMFMKEGELVRLRQQYGQQLQQVVTHLRETRFDIFWKDIVKFFVLTAAALGLTLTYFRGQLKTATFSVLVILLLVIDLFVVDAKLVDPKPHRELEQGLAADATVNFLQQQPGHFRVFPLGSLFMDATYAPYGIESLGGYSPAKLKIYQTLLDSCLYRGTDPAFPLNMSVVNMLGAEYLVAPGTLPEARFELAHRDPAQPVYTYRNTGALPRAFFVDTAIVLQSDTEVFNTLNSPAFDPRRTAILHMAPQQKESSGGTIAPPDSSARATILSYQSRRIEIETSLRQPGLMVLSEIYYPGGWRATVDEAETEILRTNYVLRSVFVPAGTHRVIFSFDPPLYRAGYVGTHLAWGLCAVLILIGLWQLPEVRKRLGGSRGPTAGSSTAELQHRQAP